MSEIDYHRLFNMRDPLKSIPIRLGVSQDSRFKDEKFHILVYQLFRGKQQASPPLYLAPVQGKKWSDIIWSAFPPIMVISETVRDILERNSLKGWSLYDVQIDQLEDNTQRYYGFAICGQAATLDIQRGEIILKPPIVVRGAPYQVMRGYYFRRDVWDGSDFFVIGNTSIIGVTERAVLILKKLLGKSLNADFKSLAEVEIDISNLQNISGE